MITTFEVLSLLHIFRVIFVILLLSYNQPPIYCILLLNILRSLSADLVIRCLLIDLQECIQAVLGFLFLIFFLVLDLIKALAKFYLLSSLYLLFVLVKVEFGKIHLKEDRCCSQPVLQTFFFFVVESLAEEVDLYLFFFLLSFSNDLQGLSFFKLSISFRNAKLIKQKIHINHQLANHIYKEKLIDTNNYQGYHFISMF